MDRLVEKSYKSIRLQLASDQWTWFVSQTNASRTVQGDESSQASFPAPCCLVLDVGASNMVKFSSDVVREEMPKETSIGESYLIPLSL